MFALHAIVLPPVEGSALACVFFGKGLASEVAVRKRLLPEHIGAQVFLGPTIEAKTELAVRYLILIEAVRADFRADGHWYRMPPGMVTLSIAAAMRSMSEAPDFPSSAEGLTRFREAAGVDGAVMAAMMGTERTRVSRLEHGKGKLTFEDYRRLRVWAYRLGLLTEFEQCFPLVVSSFGRISPADYLEATRAEDETV